MSTAVIDEPEAGTPACGDAVPEVRPGQDPELDAAVELLEQRVIGLFAKVRVSMRERAELLSPGLQPSALKALSFVIMAGRVTASELADHINSDRSTTSRLIRQLEEHGLVARVADERDGRVVNISATPEAITRVRALREKNRNQLYERMREWDREDVNRLSGLLEQLTELV
ncbi:MarR family winged helix-turn-helix transcriptional regulator [Mycetocola spongiae]|uniref:MarR family winged helix-turn-helix transcriptional regulator n=1 Tax=Mycetocola spongiae TaxID=2859226 RepID=UPI001CF0FCF7|nr:MarR family transcriptional regulator [Mycetocola spongiae]UCR88389.1 MarR family transcriptional regulator [Mycetocola spongiae]